MDNFERRAWAECRAEASDNGRKIRGYAIVFSSPSVEMRTKDGEKFREVILPEAMDRTFSEGLDVRALVDHDSSKVLGRTRSGTLQMRKDSRGLSVDIEPDQDISYARDIMLAVRRGDVSGMSFAFQTVDDDWKYEGRSLMRTVKDMRISEVSIVTFPAYQATDVQVAQRSMQAFQESQRGRNIAFLQKKLRNLKAS